MVLSGDCVTVAGDLWDVQVVPSPHLTVQIRVCDAQQGNSGPWWHWCLCSSNVLRISAWSTSLHGDCTLIVGLVKAVFLKYTVNTRSLTIFLAYTSLHQKNAEICSKYTRYPGRRWPAKGHSDNIWKRRIKTGSWRIFIFQDTRSSWEKELRW